MGEQILAVNKKAFHDYAIEDTYEAGIQLLGTEVKSLRDGGVNLKDGYARVERGEVFVYCNISPYKAGNINNHDPLRRRKLLLHQGEINRILGKTVQMVYSIVPLKIYFKRHNAIPLLHGLSQNPVNLPLVEEELAPPQRVMIVDIAGLIGADIAVDKDLSPLHAGITVLQVYPAIAQGLDLCPQELNPGLIGIFNRIVMKGLFVDR